jgi:glycerol-3-phosphate dehydrogenase
MRREDVFAQLESQSEIWDVLVIGGGATGLGTAVEAASRGYKTLLVEQHDFAKGTSSRSTKLVHGGVRYLQQGNISLVLEALHERGLLIQNAPHLVHNQSFVVPNYDWWNGPFYGIGLKVYDLLAGKLGLGRSKFLSKKETFDKIPNVEPEGLRGGIIYFDGQFDDSRLAINLAQTVCDLGGSLVNYMKVIDLLKRNDVVNGVIAVDEETGKEYRIHSRVVINATGVFTDSILKMDDPDAPTLIAVSQGAHLILDKEYLPGDSAIMVPQTEDGRVLFAVPWHGKVVVGTTDTPMETASLEPRALEEEIDFILHHAGKYMAKGPDRKDVKSVFAGLRPLVKPAHNKKTSAISRDHFLVVSRCGLVTIAGGKWTTYRKMAEDTINQAALVGGLEEKPSVTANLRIHGWLDNVDTNNHLYVYGSDGAGIEKLISENPELGEPLHPAFPYKKAEVVWHVRNEMARTVEDVLARRTRVLLLDARASIEMAPAVAQLISDELGLEKERRDEQVLQFTRLAKEYVLN